MNATIWAVTWNQWLGEGKRNAARTEQQSMADFEGVLGFLWDFLLFFSHSSDNMESNDVSISRRFLCVNWVNEEWNESVLTGASMWRCSLIFSLVCLHETVTPLGWSSGSLLWASGLEHLEHYVACDHTCICVRGYTHIILEVQHVLKVCYWMSLNKQLYWLLFLSEFLAKANQGRDCFGPQFEACCLSW